MGLVSNKLVDLSSQQNSPQEFIQEFPQETLAPQNELSLGELEFLLTRLKETDLKGHQVEFFYTLVVKLQNQYMAKAK